MGLKILNQYCDVNYNHPLMRGIISRWQVIPNFFGGSKFVDLCGRNHLILTSDVVWSAGKKTINTDGITSYAEGPISVTPTNGVTLILDLTQMAIGGTFYQYGGIATSSFDDYRIHIRNTNGSLNVGYVTYSGGTNSVSFGAGVQTPRQFALVADSTTLYAYINGNLVNTAARTNSAFNFSGSIGFAIGRQYGRGEYGAVNCRYASVHNRALSSIEILSLYKATNQKYDPTLNYGNFIDFNRFKYNYLSLQVPSLGYLSLRG